MKPPFSELTQPEVIAKHCKKFLFWEPGHVIKVSAFNHNENNYFENRDIEVHVYTYSGITAEGEVILMVKEKRRTVLMLDDSNFEALPDAGDQITVDPRQFKLYNKSLG